jgi:opacity protein-like surface antigen
MKKILVGALLLTLCATPALRAELFTNPAANIGKKNLFVGAEYSSGMSEYNLDTKNLPITSQRAFLKVTAGITDWLDIYIKGGGVQLLLDYKSLDDNVVQNFDTEKMKPGFGAGARIQLLNHVDTGTRVFLQGGGLFFTAKGNTEWSYSGKTVDKDRNMRWLDINVGIGIAKRIDFIDLNAGVGLSEIKWWIKDTTKEKIGTVTSTTHADWRNSFETKNPVMGFLGIDFILPHEYRLSVQGGVRNMDNAEITVSVSQGLEKD